MKHVAEPEQGQLQASRRATHTPALPPLLELQHCAGNSAATALVQRLAAERSAHRLKAMPTAEDSSSNEQALSGDAAAVNPRTSEDAASRLPGSPQRSLEAAHDDRVETHVNLQTFVFVQRDEAMLLGPLMKDILKRLSASRPERYLAFLTKWGSNASPFNLAKTYLKLNWEGLKYWNDVRKAAAKGHALLGHIDQLERSARVLKGGVEQIRDAWLQLPDYPLQTDDKAGRVTVSAAELEHVERYYNTAAAIANDAMHARALASRALAGWQDVLKEAVLIGDFTRKSAWEAVIQLELRFGGSGGYRTYLEEIELAASQIEASSRHSQYVAADIIGKWTPGGFVPPAPTP